MEFDQKYDIVYKKGKPSAVILNLDDFIKILERLEDYDDLKDIKEIEGKEQFRSFESFLEEID